MAIGAVSIVLEEKIPTLIAGYLGGASCTSDLWGGLKKVLWLEAALLWQDNKEEQFPPAADLESGS